jgi:hypothetical protein
MIQTTLDVSFDKPCGPLPYVMYVYEGRLASPFRSESVAMFRKLWFVVRFQNGPYYLLNHFI